MGIKLTWKPVVGYEGIYSVSNIGSIRRDKTKRRLEHNIDRNGYHRVHLCYHGKQQTFMVHRLVLEAFVGSCPEGCETRHLDGNPDNNHLENLCWGTPKENANDRKRHYKTSNGVYRNSKYTKEQVLCVVELYNKGSSIADIAMGTGMSFDCVSGIVHGRTWGHMTGIERKNMNTRQRRKSTQLHKPTQRNERGFDTREVVRDNPIVVEHQTEQSVQCDRKNVWNAAKKAIAKLECDNSPLQLYTAEEVAGILGMNAGSISALAWMGKIGSVNIKRVLRFQLSDIKEYMERRLGSES